MTPKRRRLVLALALAGAGAAALLGTSALAAPHASGATIKADDGSKVVINKYIQDGMHFSPGTITVKSGSTVTFKYGSKQQDPHTLTIVPASGLPKTVQQVNNCKACGVALGHLKNPKSPQTAGSPSNPIVHFRLNKGAPGFDTAGDSVAITPKHTSITFQVTAKPGTTLNFVCAIHPWMQGKIKVT
jgi:plastocyanin